MSETEVLPQHVKNAIEWAQLQIRDLEHWSEGPFEKKLPPGDLQDLSGLTERFMSWAALKILDARRQGALHCSLKVADYIHGAPAEFAFSQTLDLGLAGIAALSNGEELLTADEIAAAKKINSALYLVDRSLAAAGVLTYGHSFLQCADTASSLVALTISLGALSLGPSQVKSTHAAEQCSFYACPHCGSDIRCFV